METMQTILLSTIMEIYINAQHATLRKKTVKGS